MWLCFRRWGMEVWWGEGAVGDAGEGYGRMGLVVGGDEVVGMGWVEVLVVARRCQVVSGGGAIGNSRKGIEEEGVAMVGGEEGGIERCAW